MPMTASDRQSKTSWTPLTQRRTSRWTLSLSRSHYRRESGESTANGREHKYCHDGGMAFAHHHGGLAPEGLPARRCPRSPSWPRSWFPRSRSLQGKNRRVPGVRALWGQQWTRLPFCFSRKKYCHHGGVAFAHLTAALACESTTAIMALPAALEAAGLQGNAVDGFRAFWGQRWTRLLVAL
jgi:hypothetical protein